ncbi:MAG: PhoH family protein [Gaiellaceae bacterium]
MQEVLSISNDVAAELASVNDSVLSALRDRLNCTIMLRGNRLTIEGEDKEVAGALSVVDELVDLVENGHDIGASTVDAILGALDQAEDVRDVFEDVVWRHRGKKITPKTVNQKHYVDAIRACTVSFGIGPAGTGKTYLAMALAVAALSDKQVARIILTRPAVEAGERLGFGSKLVVTGEVTQVDLPREQASGLIQVQEILSGMDSVAFVRFGHEDVVRHKLVQRIVEAYKHHAEQTGTQRQR